MASGSMDKTTRVFNTQLRKLVARLFYHTYGVESVAFSPDANTLSQWIRSESFGSWMPKLVTSFQNYSKKYRWRLINCLLTCGKYIISVYHSQTLGVWDVETGNLLSDSFEGHTANVQCLGFSSDSDRVASGLQSGSIFIWGAEAGGAFRRARWSPFQPTALYK
jgi:WD40 repeat protein